MTEKNAMESTPVVQKRMKLVPPDGGWGWMVVLGTALSNIFNQSMLSLFSLLYGDAIESMGHNTEGASIVLSTMLFVANFGGPLAGVIVKLTSPRFVAVTGACFCTSGIFISGFSTNIWHLIISYGILLGTGLGFIQNSSFVAINSYFKLKKSRAVGLGNVGTGVGQTLMPHLVRYLLEKYGFQGACLILSGLSLHGIGGTMLIQPVERHMKKVEEEVIVDENLRLLEVNQMVISDNDKDTKLKYIKSSTEPNLIPRDGNEKSVDITSEKKHSSHKELSVAKSYKSENGKNGTDIAVPVIKEGLLKRMYNLFDISLLSSPRFLNVIFGTAIVTTSVQNFSMLFPFFLQKAANMDKHETAMCMSAVALADITGRLTLPYLQDKYKIKARRMLSVFVTWILIVRQILAYQTNFVVLMTMSCLYGFGRSMIIVCRNLSISAECNLKQVPAAVGLGMLTMGLVVPPLGYFLGWIRDYTDSYIVCITTQNAVLVLFLVMWIPDLLHQWTQEKRQNRKDVEQVQLK